MTVSDSDILLFLLCFTSYITIRFVIESGFILGSFLFIFIFVVLKKTSGVRQKLYLYFILLFTTKDEQKWLQRKFDFSLNSRHSGIRNEVLSSDSEADVINKTLSEFWPFISCFVEEQVRNKIEKLGARFNDSKMKPFLQYLVDFRTEEISFGSNPPKLQSVKCHLSRDMRNLIYDLHFEYSGNGCLKYSTRMKNIKVENVKMKGGIRIEIGPFLLEPPFFQEVKIFMPQSPQLHFTLSNTPEKILNLAQVLALEKISDILVMPSSLNFVLSKNEQLINFMPLHNVVNWSAEGQRATCGVREREILVKLGVIYINVVEARQLPNKEAIGVSDPYCVVQLGHQKAVSETVKRNLNPVWNFTTQMICYTDPSSGGLDLLVSVQDEDFGHEVFHDSLLRCTMNVKRIMEEGFVDEWLEPNLASRSDLHKENRAKIRVQTAWQKLSVDKTVLKENYDIENSEDGAENETTKNILNSNLEEINSSDSIMDAPGSIEAEGSLRRKKRNENFSKISLFHSIFIVWIDFAKNLQPSWELFQLEIKVFEKVEKTSFVARDKRHRWSWRRRFVFPVIGKLLQDVQIKVFPRSPGKGFATYSFPISELIKSSELELNLKNSPLSRKNQHQEPEAFLNLSVALRILEPLSNEASKNINEARNEHRKAAVRHYWHKTASQISSNKSQDSQSRTSFMEKIDFFLNSEMGWDILPSFVIPTTQKEEANHRRGSSKKKRIIVHEETKVR